MTPLYYDCETYSETPIRDGTFVYAQNAEIMLVTYAYGDGPVQCWDLTAGEPMPFDLEMLLEDDNQVVIAHHALFDRTICRLAKNSPPLLQKLGNQIERWRCTMVKCLAHSLPGSLDKVGEILRIEEADRKIKDGRQLILLLCKPRPVSSKIRRATSATHPAEWQKFKEYAIADIPSMRAIDKKLPTWNYSDTPGSAGAKELALWHLDQRINDTGILVDVELCEAAIDAAEAAKKGLAARTVELTNGEVEKTTQRDKLLLHILESYGVTLPDMQSSTLQRRIDDPDLPLELRELLDIRMQASMGSTSKYKSMLKARNSDDRVRGILQFNGASRTRRWAGRTVQPQNMFRPPKYIKKQWEFVMEAIKSGSVDLIFPNVMETTAAAARGGLIVPKGKKMVVADLANIEGRTQAWLSGEEWKLQAFRDYDNGTGHDLYKLSYAKSFRINAADVDDDQRSVGKVQELALAYSGGVGAFLTFSLAYGIDLEAMSEEAQSFVPVDTWAEAEGFWDWSLKTKRTTFGLSKRAFVTCDSFKRLWRAAHPNIVENWKEITVALERAIANPGKTFVVRRTKFRRDGAWLRIGMPSGRCLCYPSPEIDEKGNFSYMGINQYTRKWQRIRSYSGMVYENENQMLARDFMADNMPGIEAAGYMPLATIHDEIVTETPDSDEFNSDTLSALLSANPEWALDIPLSSAGWEGPRYRKD